MFKRLRTIKGDTLALTFNKPNGFRRVSRAQVTKGSGTPIARFSNTINESEINVVLNCNDSSRMSGTYRYEVAIETDKGVHTIQHGILEVM